MLAGLGVVALSGGCTGAGEGVSSGPANVGDETARVSEAVSEAASALQPNDRVDITLFFGNASGGTPFLTPTTREVGVDDELPRRALELLVAGPRGGDAEELSPVLPSATKVRSVAVSDGTATVDLSSEVIAESDQVGTNPGAERLALAAVANTLTQFPSIEEVKLTVEGRTEGRVSGVADVGEFWGGWGLPRVLTRDKTIVGPPPEGRVAVDLGQFERHAQTVGVEDGTPVTVKAVSTQNRTTYLRFVLELAVDPPESRVRIPRSRAIPVAESIVLEVEKATSYEADFTPSQSQVLSDEALSDLAVESQSLPGTLKLRLQTAKSERFWLHTKTNPARIVLDVAK